MHKHSTSGQSQDLKECYNLHTGPNGHGNNLGKNFYMIGALGPATT